MRTLIAVAFAMIAACAVSPASAQRYGSAAYGATTTVRCESNDGRTRECATGGGRAMLQRQISSAPCIEGRTWGTGRGGVWVSQGCRADFRVAAAGYGNGNGVGGIVRCESIDNRMSRCAINGASRVQLVRKLSDASCVEGRSWGYDRNSIWVSQGCRAEFAANRGNAGGWDNSRYGGQVFRCESVDGRTRECAANTRAGVQLVRQLSDAACVQGRSWGYGRTGIWVSQGCRAEFRSH